MKILKNKNTRILLVVALLLIVIAAVILYLILGRGKYGNDGLERKPVAEAVSEAKNVLDNTYENFTLPDDFVIVCGDKLYDITVNSCNNADNDAKKLAFDLATAFSGVTVDESNMSEVYHQDVPNIYSGVYEEHMFSTQGDGYYNILATAEEYGFHNRNFDHDNPKEYIIGKDTIEGISYNVGGEEYLLTDALNFVTDEFNTKYKSFCPGCDGITPYGIYVFSTTDTGESYYVIAFELIYKGTPLMKEGYVEDLFNEGIFGFVCEFQIQKPNDCSSFTIYPPYPTEEREIKEIITLESALEHLEINLAPNSNYEISEISLKYCRYFENTNATTMSTSPYWCFTVQTGGSERGYYSPRKVIYVDAQSGDIYCYNSITQIMDFKYLMEEKE